MIKPPAHWHILSEQQLQSCTVFDLYKRKYKHPVQNKEADFYVLKANDWVQCIALTPDEHLIFVQQYRFGAATLCWEFPGGTVEKQEDPKQTALRELEEETGYKGTHAEYLRWCYPNPATLNNRCHFVLIEGCTHSSKPQWDEHEEMAIEIFTWEDVLTRLKTGQFNHAVTWASLAMLANHKQWKLF